MAHLVELTKSLPALVLALVQDIASALNALKKSPVFVTIPLRMSVAGPDPGRAGWGCGARRQDQRDPQVGPFVIAFVYHPKDSFMPRVCRRLSACAVAASLIVSAQTAPKPALWFEVASVRPGDQSVDFGGIEFTPEGRFTATNSSLQRLIGFAYDVRNYQMSKGPNWVDSDKFTIEARADSSIQIPPGLAGFVPMRLMLQSLLAERFHLAAHKEMRQEQVYELVLDKEGSKLREVKDPGQLRVGRGELIGKGAPIEFLVSQLSRQLEQTVIDKTGLKGRYDFTLNWAPDTGLAGARPEEPDAPPAPDPSGPSIFTAVRRDLGLRLQSAKAPVEILVIDHVERPDPN
jgi:uncharacterized protein (TIGR03435 family)